MSFVKTDTEGLPEGWRLTVVQKPIRNIYFRADARQKIFKVSAPLDIRRSVLLRAIRSKRGWMEARAAEPCAPSLVPASLGKNCMFRGKAYPLSVLRTHGGSCVAFDPEEGIVIRVKEGADPVTVLTGWYRKMLLSDIAGLLAIWEPELSVRTSEYRIRRMKTRWGSCNIQRARIWINEALICLAPDLLEYVVVHELVHLHEPSHGVRFYRFMDRYLPDWRLRKHRLSPFAAGL